MNLFGLFKRGGSAPVARDRLQVLLSLERTSTNRGASDLLFILRDEILTAVGRHVEIDPERVTVQMDRGEKVSVLEVDIEIPNNFRPVSTASRKKRIAGPAHRPA
ncbi:MAG TPA: cell division topological specificity factor MinE [Pseudolabrys sp.]|nr:cell division topological specificity factor MinE [Pseudolabrys sp.]